MGPSNFCLLGYQKDGRIVADVLEAKAMKIYHGLKDVPELAGLSRSERRQVLRACFIRFGFSDWHWWLAASAELVFILLGGFVGIVLHYLFGFPAFVDYACKAAGLAMGLSIYGIIYYSVVIDRLRPRFRDYIAAGKLRV